MRLTGKDRASTIPTSNAHIPSPCLDSRRCPRRNDSGSSVGLVAQSSGPQQADDGALGRGQDGEWNDDRQGNEHIEVNQRAAVAAQFHLQHDETDDVNHQRYYNERQEEADLVVRQGLPAIFALYHLLDVLMEEASLTAARAAALEPVPDRWP